MPETVCLHASVAAHPERRQCDGTPTTLPACTQGRSRLVTHAHRTSPHCGDVYASAALVLCCYNARRRHAHVHKPHEPRWPQCHHAVMACCPSAPRGPTPSAGCRNRAGTLQRTPHMQTQASDQTTVGCTMCAAWSKQCSEACTQYLKQLPRFVSWYRHARAFRVRTSNSTKPLLHKPERLHAQSRAHVYTCTNGVRRGRRVEEQGWGRARRTCAACGTGCAPQQVVRCCARCCWRPTVVTLPSSLHVER